MMRSSEIDNLSLAARQAARAGDWRTVSRCAKQILKRDRDSAEGHFLAGQAAKAAGMVDAAEKSFQRALAIDNRRYDAAVELAELYVRLQRNREAVASLQPCVGQLGNSPLYLEMAASAYSRMDLHEEALPLYRRASELQPGIERFRTGLAACNVCLGEVDKARRIYEELLRRHPNHQRFHYELAQLARAADLHHVFQMKAVLDQTALPARENIFLYYAIGKELEDLGLWDEAFEYYERGGNAVKAVSPYNVATDIELIDTIIETCSESWLRSGAQVDTPQGSHPSPIFVVGLPRTGTTLTERIISSHSLVGSVGETFFLPQALRAISGVRSTENLNAEIVRAAAAAAPGDLSSRYVDAVSYKLGKEPMFVEKLPENFLLIGFIVRSFQEHAVIHLRRHPMDACFAMYKQSYFRYAYSLEDLGRYYVAYDRLMSHWRSLLGDRLIEVSYEDLVANPEERVRHLLNRLSLSFEDACLNFESSRASSRTASAVQVREKMHTRSVNRWQHFERQLVPLQSFLISQGIAAQ
jgi:tetratricopeptide (TPR) repeat protein